MFRKKQNKNFIDDGQTVANMNVQGMPWYQSKKMIKSKKNLVDLNLLPRERRAIILGAYKAYLPVFLGILGGFVVAYLLFLLWAVYLV